MLKKEIDEYSDKISFPFVIELWGKRIIPASVMSVLSFVIFFSILMFSDRDIIISFGLSIAIPILLISACYLSASRLIFDNDRICIHKKFGKVKVIMKSQIVNIIYGPNQIMLVYIPARFFLKWVISVPVVFIPVQTDLFYKFLRREYLNKQ